MIALKYAFMFGASIPPAHVGVHIMALLILGCFPFQMKVVIMACILLRWDCRKVIGVVLNVLSTFGRRYILDKVMRPAQEACTCWRSSVIFGSLEMRCEKLG